MSFIKNLFGLIKRIFGGGSTPVALDVDTIQESSNEYPQNIAQVEVS